MTISISVTLAMFGIATAAGLAAASSARAEVQYPWCAEYRSSQGGTNCGFVSYQQCLATISGVGGGCYRNPAYLPPRERTRRR